MFEINSENERQNFNFRLTSLWVLSEIGGSLLGAMKFPITGMLMAMCSVLMLALFFRVNGRDSRPVAVALAVVAIIKLCFNPTVPYLAFAALFFQVGFCMMLFERMRDFERACLVAGVVCLLHTGLQMLFLKMSEVNFWSFKTAFLPTVMFDRMILDVARSNVFFKIAYLSMFVAAGWLAGKWAFRLPDLIERERQFLQTLETLPTKNLTEKQKIKLAKKEKQQSDYKLPKQLFILGAGFWVFGNFKTGLKVMQFGLLWLATFTNFFQTQVVPRVHGFLTLLFFPEQQRHFDEASNFKKMSSLVASAWLIAKEERTWVLRVERFVALVFALGLRGGGEV